MAGVGHARPETFGIGQVIGHNVPSTDRLMPASAWRRPRSGRPGDAGIPAFANAWGMPVIEVTGLRKEYGSKVAVEDVSFMVEAGEIFGILGPNGAGKTTTVECVTGLRTPDRGVLRAACCPVWSTDSPGFGENSPAEPSYPRSLTESIHIATVRAGIST
jgi:ABC-type multidrug transport system fused ATPase/permease subunit